LSAVRIPLMLSLLAGEEGEALRGFYEYFFALGEWTVVVDCVCFLEVDVGGCVERGRRE
jgi:hypothetical protein